MDEYDDRPSAIRARLDLLTGQLEAAYEEIMGIDAARRLPDYLAYAMTAAALLGDVDGLGEVAAGITASPARGRVLGSLRRAVEGSAAALRGDIDGAVAGFSQSLAFRYLRIDRANVQGLFASLVGREVPEARAASDGAFEVLTDAGAYAYIDLYEAGLPATGARRVAGS